MFDHFVRHRAKEILQKKSAAKTSSCTELKQRVTAERLGDESAALALTVSVIREGYKELTEILDDKEIGAVLDEVLAPLRKKLEEERAAKLVPILGE